MSDFVEKLEKYKASLQAARDQVANLNGQLTAVKSALSDKYEVTSLSAAKKLLQSKQDEARRLDAEITERMNALEEEYAELLRSTT